MATSVDERVVQMQFDNAQFEKGVQETLNSLNKLNKAIDENTKSNSGKSLDGISNSLDAMRGSFSKVEGAVSSLGRAFSPLGVAGQRIIGNITDKLFNLATTTAKTVTGINQISSGFQRFNDKTSAVSTLMTATGASMKDVSKTMSELQWFTDQTSYEFTSMIDTMAKMSASGEKDLGKLLRFTEGFALAAAKAGVGANKTSHAMYQLSQAASRGYIQYQDWQQALGLTNIATDDLKKRMIEAGGEAAVAAGAYKDFNSSLKKGWLTIDVFADVMDDFTQGINSANYSLGEDGFIESCNGAANSTTKFSEEAFRCAQECRTWADVLNAIQDAMATGWSTSLEYVLGNTKQIKSFFTDIANAAINIGTGIADWRNKILADWNALGGRHDLLKTVSNIFNAIYDRIEPIRRALMEVFGIQINGNSLKGATSGIERFTESLKLSSDQMLELKDRARNVFMTIKNIFVALGKYKDKIISFVSILVMLSSLKSIFSGGLGLGTVFSILKAILAFNVLKRINGCTSATQLLSKTFGDLAKKIKGNKVLNTIFETLKKIGAYIAVFVLVIIAGIQKIVASLKSADFSGKANKVILVLKTIGMVVAAVAGGIVVAIGTIIGAIAKLIGNVKNGVSAGGFIGGVKAFFTTIKDFVVNGFTTLFDYLKNTAFGKWIADLFTKIASYISSGFANIKNNIQTQGVGNFIASIFKTIYDLIIKGLTNLGSIITKWKPQSKFGQILQKIIDRIVSITETIVKVVGAVIKTIYESIKNSKIGQLISQGIQNAKDNFQKLGDFFKIKDFFSGLTKGADGAVTTVANMSGSIQSNTTTMANTFGQNMDSMSNSAVKTTGVFATLALGIQNFFKQLGANLETLKETNPMIKGLVDYLSNIDWQKVLGLAVLGLYVWQLYKFNKAISSLSGSITKVAETFGGIGASFKMLMSTISGTFSSISGYIKSLTKLNNAQTFRDVAIGIGLLAASLALLAMVPIDRLGPAVLIVLMLAKAVQMITKELTTMAQVAKPGALLGIAAVMLSFAASVAILVGALEGLAILNTIIIRTSNDAVQALMELATPFVELMSIMGLLLVVLKSIAPMSTQLLAAAKTLAVIGGAFAALGAGLIVLGLALKIIIPLFEKVTLQVEQFVKAWVDWMADTDSATEMLRKCTIIATFFALLYAGIELLKKAMVSLSTVGKGASLGFMGMAASLLTLAIALKIFETIDWPGIGKGLVAVGSLVTILMLAVGLMKKFKITRVAQSVKRIGIAMMTLSIGVLALSLSIKALAGLDFGAMMGAVLGISSLLAAMAASARIMNKVDIGKVAAGILSLVAALYLLTPIVALYSLAGPEMTGGLVSVMAMMAVIAKCVQTMEKFDGKAALPGLIAMSAVITVLTACIVQLSTIKNVAAGITGAAELAGLLIIFSIFTNNMSKIAQQANTLKRMQSFLGVFIATCAGMSLAAIALSGAVAQIAKVGDIKATIAAAAEIAGLLITFGIIADKMSEVAQKVSTLSKASAFFGTFITTIGGLTIAAGFLSKFIGELAKVNDSAGIDSAIVATAEIAGLLTVFGSISVGLSKAMQVFSTVAKMRSFIPVFITTIGSMIGAVVALGSMLALIAKMPVDQSMAAMMSLVVVMGMFKAMTQAITAIVVPLTTLANFIPTLIVTVAAMAGVVTVLGSLLYGIATLPVERARTAAESLSLTMIAFAAAVGMLSAVAAAMSSLGGIGIATFAVTVGVFAGAASLLALAMGQLAGVDYKSILAMSVAMVAMAAAIDILVPGITALTAAFTASPLGAVLTLGLAAIIMGIAIAISQAAKAVAEASQAFAQMSSSINSLSVLVVILSQLGGQGNQLYVFADGMRYIASASNDLAQPLSTIAAVGPSAASGILAYGNAINRLQAIMGNNQAAQWGYNMTANLTSGLLAGAPMVEAAAYQVAYGVYKMVHQSDGDPASPVHMLRRHGEMYDTNLSTGMLANASVLTDAAKSVMGDMVDTLDEEFGTGAQKIQRNWKDQIKDVWKDDSLSGGDKVAATAMKAFGGFFSFMKKGTDELKQEWAEAVNGEVVIDEAKKMSQGVDQAVMHGMDQTTADAIKKAQSGGEEVGETAGDSVSKESVITAIQGIQNGDYSGLEALAKAVGIDVGTIAGSNAGSVFASIFGSVASQLYSSIDGLSRYSTAKYGSYTYKKDKRTGKMVKDKKAKNTGNAGYAWKEGNKIRMNATPADDMDNSPFNFDTDDLTKDLDNITKSAGGAGGALDDAGKSAGGAGDSAEKASDQFDDLADSLSFFETFDPKLSEKISPEKMLFNFKSQAMGMKQFYQNLQTMAMKGFDKSIIQSFVDEGISAYPKVSGMLQATTEQVAQLNAAWNSREAIAAQAQQMAQVALTTSDEIAHLREVDQKRQESTNIANDAYTKYQEIANGIIEKGGDISTELQNSNSEAAQSWNEFIEAAQNAGYTMEDVQQLMESGAEGFVHQKDAVLSATEAYAQAAEAIAKFNDIGLTISQTMEKQYASVVGGFDKFNSDFNMGIDELMSNVQSQIDGLAQYSNNVNTIIQKGGGELVALFGDKITPEIANALAQGNEDQIKTITDQMKFLQNAPLQYAQGNQQTWFQFGQVGGLGYQQALDQLATNGAILGKAQTIGTNIGQGLVTGMQQSVSSVTTQGTTLGTDAVEGVATGAQTHSPSAFTTDVGINIVQGLYNGLTNSGIDIEGAAENLGTKVVNAVALGVTNSTAIFNSLSLTILQMMGDALMTNSAAFPWDPLLQQMFTQLTPILTTDVTAWLAGYLPSMFDAVYETVLAGFITGISSHAPQLLEGLSETINGALQAWLSTLVPQVIDQFAPTLTTFIDTWLASYVPGLMDTIYPTVLSGVITGLTATVPNLLTGIEGTISTLMSAWLTEFIPSFFDQIAPMVLQFAVAAVQTYMPGIIDAIHPVFLEALIAGLQTYLPQLFEGILPVITEQLSTAITTYMPQIFETINPIILQALLTALPQFLPQVFEAVFPIILEQFTVALTTYMPMLFEGLYETFLAQVIVGIQTYMPMMFEELYEVIVEQFIVALETYMPMIFAEIYETIIEQLNVAITTYLPMIFAGIYPTVVSQLVIALETYIPMIMAEIYPTLLDQFTVALEDYLPTLFEDLSETFVDLISQGIEDNLPDILEGVQDSITTVITDWLNKYLETALPDIIEGTQDTLNETIKKCLEDYLEDVTDEIEPVLEDWLNEIFEDVMPDLLDDALMSFVTPTKKSLEKYFKEVDKEIKKQLDKLYKNIVKYIKNYAKKLENEIKKIMKKIIQILRSFYSQFYEVGRYLVQGFIAGMKSMLGEVYAAAYEIGSTAVQGLKDGAGVHSPSKYAYEVASYFADGFINGLDDRIIDVRRSVMKFGEAAVDQLRTEMKGYLKDWITARDNYWKWYQENKRVKRAINAAKRGAFESLAGDEGNFASGHGDSAWDTAEGAIDSAYSGALKRSEVGMQLYEEWFDDMNEELQRLAKTLKVLTKFVKESAAVLDRFTNSYSGMQMMFTNQTPIMAAQSAFRDLMARIFEASDYFDDEFENSAKEAGDFKDYTRKMMQAFTEAFDELRSSAYEAMDLWEEFELDSSKIMDASTVLNNAASQLNGNYKLAESIMKIAQRGILSYDALKDLVDSHDLAKTLSLLYMTSDELKEYNDDFELKGASADFFASDSMAALAMATQTEKLEDLNELSEKYGKDNIKAAVNFQKNGLEMNNEIRDTVAQLKPYVEGTKEVDDEFVELYKHLQLLAKKKGFEKGNFPGAENELVYVDQLIHLGADWLNLTDEQKEKMTDFVKAQEQSTLKGKALTAANLDGIETEFEAYNKLDAQFKKSGISADDLFNKISALEKQETYNNYLDPYIKAERVFQKINDHLKTFNEEIKKSYDSVYKTFDAVKYTSDDKKSSAAQIVADQQAQLDHLGKTSGISQSIIEKLAGKEDVDKYLEDLLKKGVDYAEVLAKDGNEAFLNKSYELWKQGQNATQKEADRTRRTFKKFGTVDGETWLSALQKSLKAKEKVNWYTSVNEDFAKYIHKYYGDMIEADPQKWVEDVTKKYQDHVEVTDPEHSTFARNINQATEKAWENNADFFAKSGESGFKKAWAGAASVIVKGGYNVEGGILDYRGVLESEEYKKQVDAETEKAVEYTEEDIAKVYDAALTTEQLNDKYGSGLVSLADQILNEKIDLASNGKTAANDLKKYTDQMEGSVDDISDFSGIFAKDGESIAKTFIALSRYSIKAGYGGNVVDFLKNCTDLTDDEINKIKEWFPKIANYIRAFYSKDAKEATEGVKSIKEETDELNEEAKKSGKNVDELEKDIRESNWSKTFEPIYEEAKKTEQALQGWNDRANEFKTNVGSIYDKLAKNPLKKSNTNSNKDDYSGSYVHDALVQTYGDVSLAGYYTRRLLDVGEGVEGADKFVSAVADELGTEGLKAASKWDKDTFIENMNLWNEVNKANEEEAKYSAWYFKKHGKVDGKTYTEAWNANRNAQAIKTSFEKSFDGLMTDTDATAEQVGKWLTEQTQEDIDSIDWNGWYLNYHDALTKAIEDWQEWINRLDEFKKSLESSYDTLTSSPLKKVTNTNKDDYSGSYIEDALNQHLANVTTAGYLTRRLLDISGGVEGADQFVAEINKELGVEGLKAASKWDKDTFIKNMNLWQSVDKASENEALLSRAKFKQIGTVNGKAYIEGLNADNIATETRESFNKGFEGIIEDGSKSADEVNKWLGQQLPELVDGLDWNAWYLKYHDAMAKAVADLQEWNDYATGLKDSFASSFSSILGDMTQEVKMNENAITSNQLLQNLLDRNALVHEAGDISRDIIAKGIAAGLDSKDVGDFAKFMASKGIDTLRAAGALDGENLITAVNTYLENTKIADEEAEWTTDRFKELGKIGGKTFEEAFNSAQVATDIFNTFSDVAKDHINLLIDEVPSFVQKALDELKKFTDVASPYIDFDDWGKATENGASDASKAAKSIFDKVSDNLKAAKDGTLKDSAQELGISISSDVLSNITSGMSSGMGDVESAIGQNMTELGTKLTDKVDANFKAAKEGKLKDSAQDLGISIGNDYVSGMINALQSNENAISAENAGYNVGVAVKNGTADALDIHSPSKVAEQFGNYYVQGFANGISNNTSIATDSVTGLSNDVVDAVQNALILAYNILSGEGPVQPTITPVLDLSNVHDGYDNIRKTLSGTNGLTIGANMGNLTTPGQVQQTQQVIATLSDKGDIILAINNLGSRVNAISDKVDHLQVVMDSGTLVGEITPKVNQQLGIQYRRQNRA